MGRFQDIWNKLGQGNSQSKDKSQDKGLEKEIISAKAGTSAINGAKESIYNGLTPLRLANVFKELKRGNPREFLILAEEFEEKDPHFISVLQTRKRALITVDPVLLTGDIKDKRVIDACNRLIDKPFFTNLVMDLLDAISKGFSVCEIKWKGGEVVGYKYLPAYWFAYDEFETLKVWDDLGVKLLPLLGQDGGKSHNSDFFDKKFIIHEPASKSSVQMRNGLMLPASVYLLFKAYAVKDFKAFAEVFGMPYRIGKYIGEPTSTEIATLKRAVADLGMDTGAVIPESMQIEL